MVIILKRLKFLRVKSKKSGNESRAALSLLANCKYQMEQYDIAASYYSKLIQMCSDNDDYKFDLAMCLYKACDYQGAIKASYSVQSSKYTNKISQLQSAIKYMEDDLPAAKALIEKQSEEDEDA